MPLAMVPVMPTGCASSVPRLVRNADSHSARVPVRGGWGIGAGLYGAGALRFIACNPAYASCPLVDVIGDRVDAFAITCTAMIPL